jgi:hypothetical protein
MAPDARVHMQAVHAWWLTVSFFSADQHFFSPLPSCQPGLFFHGNPVDHQEDTRQ